MYVHLKVSYGGKNPYETMNILKIHNLSIGSSSAYSNYLFKRGVFPYLPVPTEIQFIATVTSLRIIFCNAIAKK